MTRLATTARARSRWAAHMTDACTIEKATGDTINAFGTRTVTWLTVYSGACLVFPMSPSDAEAGGIQAELRGYDLRLPYDTVNISSDDRVTITTSEDPYLVNRMLTVRNVAGDSFNGVRVVYCEFQCR